MHYGIEFVRGYGGQIRNRSMYVKYWYSGTTLHLVSVDTQLGKDLADNATRRRCRPIAGRTRHLPKILA